MGNLTIQEAKLAPNEGRLEPFVRIDGQWYSMETKPTLLAAGIAYLQPVLADWSQNLEGGFHFSAVLPADPEDGRLAPLEIADATNDAQVVALARRAAELLSREDARPGSLLA